MGDLRHIPEGFAPDVVRRIDGRLADIRAEHGVSIPWAVESGSRAWGFPSPDSDYDCRFVFVRPIDQHLTPWPRRDVIETPLDDVLDVNGWELGKALKLLLKGNSVIIEWLKSPVVYGGDPAFRDALLGFGERFADRQVIARHYLHMGQRQRRKHFTDHASVPQKKIFYALRPAAALRWLRLRPEAVIAPMHFPTLMRECDPPEALAALVEDLMARKAISHEMGTEALPPAIGAFIDQEFDLAARDIAPGPALLPPAARDEAERLYLSAVRRWGG
jgi:predicted nucleotidyltransferase